MKAELTTAFEAETFRRSHCERKGQEHVCVGVITIHPGVCMLDCTRCGTAIVSTVEAMNMLDAYESVVTDVSM